jgi:hypothetical protein
MSTPVTDDQIQALAATAKPYSLALLHWTPQRTMDGADAIELEHQRALLRIGSSFRWSAHHKKLSPNRTTPTRTIGARVGCTPGVFALLALRASR